MPTAGLQAVADGHFTKGYREPERVNLYACATDAFRDVSDEVIQAMLEDVRRGLCCLTIRNRATRPSAVAATPG